MLSKKRSGKDYDNKISLASMKVLRFSDEEMFEI